MNTPEPKNAFLALRANGWSLRSISRELGIPKSTLFNWESDAPTRRTINVLKSLQLEKLQERYIPSFEEELQKLSTCLARIERALEKQDYDAMRPEFLLRTSLQLRARLNTLRSDIQPVRTLNDGEIPEIPLPGCISRSQTILESDDDASPSPLEGQDEGEGAVRVANADLREPTSARPVNGTKWDKNEKFSEPEPSAPATSNSENGTTVPNPFASPRETINPILPIPSHPGSERYGDLAIPLSNIPVTADEIALAASFNPFKTPRGEIELVGTPPKKLGALPPNPLTVAGLSFVPVSVISPKRVLGSTRRRSRFRHQPR